MLAVIVLALLGGGAYWYLQLRPAGADWQYPWTPLVKMLKSRAPAETTAAKAPTHPVTVDSAAHRFDVVSDSLTIALTGFADRAQRFGGQSSDCAGLDSGLVALEDAWTSYNLRQQSVQPLDAPRAGRDQQLAAAADSAEATFERSGCPRP